MSEMGWTNSHIEETVKIKLFARRLVERGTVMVYGSADSADSPAVRLEIRISVTDLPDGPMPDEITVDIPHLDPTRVY